MNSITLQELGRQAPALARQLEQGGELLVTKDDKPVAVLFPTDGEALDPCMKAWRRARNLLALERVQRESVARGMDKMTMEEINAEIAAYRRESAGN